MKWFLIAALIFSIGVIVACFGQRHAQAQYGMQPSPPMRQRQLVAPAPAPPPMEWQQFAPMQQPMILAPLPPVMPTCQQVCGPYGCQTLC